MLDKKQVFVLFCLFFVYFSYLKNIILYSIRFCVYVRTDGEINCSDASDEANCPTVLLGSAAVSAFTCINFDFKDSPLDCMSVMNTGAKIEMVFIVMFMVILFTLLVDVMLKSWCKCYRRREYNQNAQQIRFIRSHG